MADVTPEQVRAEDRRLREAMYDVQRRFPSGVLHPEDHPGKVTPQLLQEWTQAHSRWWTHYEANIDILIPF